MEASFIAAILITLIANGVIVALCYSLSKMAGNKIRENVIQQMKVYNHIMEEKSNQLQAIQQQILEEKNKLGEIESCENIGQNENSTPIFPKGTTYRNLMFHQDYDKIQKEFSFDQEQVTHNIEQLTCKKDKDWIVLAKKLMKELSINTIYQLIQVSKQEQWAILSDILKEEYQPVLDEYEASHSHYDGIEFYEWLENITLSHSGVIKVVMNTKDKVKIKQSGVEVVQKEGICEGYQIYYNNRLYDYSITENDLV